MVEVIVFGIVIGIGAGAAFAITLFLLDKLDNWLTWKGE